METANKVDTFRQITQLLHSWAKTSDELHKLQTPQRPVKPAIISTPADFSDYVYQENRFREVMEMVNERRNQHFAEMKEIENRIFAMIPGYMSGIPIEVKVATKTYRLRKKITGELHEKLLIITEIDPVRELATADANQ